MEVDPKFRAARDRARQRRKARATRRAGLWAALAAVTVAGAVAGGVWLWLLRPAPAPAPMPVPETTDTADAADGPYSDAGEMDAEALLAASAAMLLNLPRDPIIVSRPAVADAVETGTRFLPGSDALPSDRFGPPSAQRLRLVTDRLVRGDGEGLLRLPSRAVDFAYQRVLQRQEASGAGADGTAPEAAAASFLAVRPAERRPVPAADAWLRPADAEAIAADVADLGLPAAQAAQLTALLGDLYRPDTAFLIRHVPPAEKGGPPAAQGRPLAVAARHANGQLDFRLPAEAPDSPTPWEARLPSSDWLDRAVARADPQAAADESRAAAGGGAFTLLDALYAAGTRNGLETDVVNGLLTLLSEAIDLDDPAPADGRLTLLFNDSLGREQHLSAIAYIGIESERAPMACYLVTAIETGDLSCHARRVGRAYLGDAVFGVPVAGFLTSRFGFRVDPITGEQGRMHSGLDWAAAPGTPVFAAADGVYLGVGVVGGYGNLVQLRHDDGFTTRYAHLQDFAETAEIGRPVARGEVIGYVGNTGRSTGPHLHFEVRQNGQALDPLPFVTAAEGGGEAIGAPVVAGGVGGPSDPETRAFVEAVDALLEVSGPAE
jgi:murein DD-endopeptidase MepM/ murein hydrolase activator NlpD